MTNIISLSRVKREYEVSYDGEDFIIHRAKHGYSDMVFKPHPSRLHVYDQDDPRGHASYSFIVTVEDNMSLFTKRQVASADLARNLQAGLAYPSVPDLKWIVKANMLKDSPVTSQDVDVALKIWGPSVALLKGKTVRCKPPFVMEDVIEVPREIWQLHKRLTLTIDIFFVNGVPYFCNLQPPYLFFVGDAPSEQENPDHLQSFKSHAQLLPSARFSDCVYQGRWGI